MTSESTTTIRFALKDAGRESLATAIGNILRQDAVYDGTQNITRAVGGYIVNCSSRQRNTKGGVAVNIRFSMTNSGRRAFANAIGEILGLDVVYNRTPTFSYTVGGYTIDRNGVLIVPAGTNHRETNRLVVALDERGYVIEADSVAVYQGLQATERAAPTVPVAPPSALPPASDRLVVDMPREHFTDKAIDNLNKIIASKSALMMKALGTDSLPLIIGEEKLHFPWFILTGADGEIDAYLRFVTALCKMARESQRITAKERELVNDKFAMRVFLIRLGFVGPEYKVARKILLRNLTGNSSWKDGQPSARVTRPDAPEAPPEK